MELENPNFTHSKIFGTSFCQNQARDEEMAKLKYDIILDLRSATQKFLLEVLQARRQI
jgi:hypothetical protein